MTANKALTKSTNKVSSVTKSGKLQIASKSLIDVSQNKDNSILNNMYDGIQVSIDASEVYFVESESDDEKV